MTEAVDGADTETPPTVTLPEDPHPVIAAYEADRPTSRDRMLAAGIAAIKTDLEPVYRAAAGNPSLQAFARALEQSLRNIFVLLLDGSPEA